MADRTNWGTRVRFVSFFGKLDTKVIASSPNLAVLSSRLYSILKIRIYLKIKNFKNWKLFFVPIPYSSPFATKGYISKSAKRRDIVIGPASIPIGPKNAIPPKTDSKIRNGCNSIP